MEQFDQLLTCCICLDRYKTPKLLPCQHSYCMEPCMEGLVDYVKRQVKCPECRAEHRVPYNGIQGFPTNYTLQKFLELHTEITGELPDPNSDAIMSRCNVCSEKAYVNPCAHCDKKVCDDCKEAHCDILKREISRVNNQVKRGLHRLEECLKQVERNQQLLESNATQVTADIDEIHRRLSLAVKERCEYLKSSVDTYLTSELKNLKELRSNLDLELTNIQQNSDLIEKHMADDIKWDDNELMDTKDIFIKMMDFIRNYDAGSDEYTRRIRFVAHESQSNELARKILEVGEIKIHDPKPSDSLRDRDDDIPIRSSGLARSKSDHRLVAEFRRREETDKSPPTRRRFGESRYSREDNKSRTNFGRSYGGDDEDEDSAGGGRGRFRSRFLRPDDDEDIGSGNRKSMHEDEEGGVRSKPDRIKVVDTEDASRGPLSGCIRLADSSRIIQRLKEMEMAKLKPKKEKEAKPAVPKFVPLKPDPEAYANFGKKPQEESDDQKRMRAEIIAKQKAGSASAASATPANKAPVPAPRTFAGAVNAGSSVTANTSQVHRQPTEDSETESSSSSEEEDEDEAPVANETPAAAAVNAEEDEGDESEYEYYDEEDWEEEEPATTTPAAPATKPATPATPTVPVDRKTSITNSTPYNNSYSAGVANSSSTAVPNKTAVPNNANSQTPSSYVNRYSAMKSPPPPSTTIASSLTSTTVASPTAAPTSTTRAYGGARTTPNIGSLSASATANSSQETDEDVEMSRPSSSAASSRYRRMRDDSESFVNKYLAQSRRASVEQENKTNNNAVNSNTDPNPTSIANSNTNNSANEDNGNLNALSTRKLSGESQYPSGRSRYAALKERRNKAVARSKSSALLGGLGNNANTEDAEEDDDDEQMPFTRKFGSELSKSRSSHHLKAGDSTDQQQPIPGGNADDENLSSWARYLKNKYGGRNKNRDTNDSGLQQQGSNSNINTANVNVLNSRNSMIVNNQFGVGVSGNSGNNQYIQKQTLLMTFGSRGSQPGLFTWPRGIAVGPDNTIVVADSSNHRVQIFNEAGQHRLSFGCYGNGEGEFDCLAGVAVNRIGQYIIADRYNHRIQIFDPSGHFLRSFGSQGTIDGKFSYPWGITTDALGFIYVCDKENHRVQVFQSDGTFVGKFGVMGSKPGQLEHPHYIAVSNTNRVIVSDSNNHRIQIFDVNGKVLSTFGSEGTEEGQFKFPRGVAVDEQGYIFVADSGNNRIQIFNPDGTFLRGFGRWGQGAGEFKGLEGIAVNSKGNILVADRENHRVQMF